MKSLFKIVWSFLVYNWCKGEKRLSLGNILRYTICYHRLGGSASTVLTAGNRPSQWEMANFDPIENTEPTSKKTSAQLITSARGPWPSKPNLAQDRYPSSVGFWANGCNMTYCELFIYLNFFSETRVYGTGQAGWWMFTCDSSKDVKSRFWTLEVIKLKFNVKPLFIPKTDKFWQKTGLSFAVVFGRKRLTMGQGAQK